MITNRRQLPAQIEKRGYVWQCAIPDNKKKYCANFEAKKQPCGRFNAYFGKKWAAGKKDAKWQATCSNPQCQADGSTPRRKQLNMGNVWPESPKYYETREATIEAAADFNAQEELKQARRNQEDDGRFL